MLGRRELLSWGLLTAIGCKKHPDAVPEKNLKGQMRTNLDSPRPTPAQLARKERSEQRVKALGLPTLDGLPVTEESTAIRPRSTSEVVQRCLANTFAAVRGETNDKSLAAKLVADFGVAAALSPDERTFLNAASPTQQELTSFSWRYECTHVFLWALSYVPDLGAADRQSDVEKDVRIIRERGPSGFAAAARLRPLDELLEENDYYYRLDWAAVELRAHPNPKANEEIIVERHRALNWLIRYMNQEWDDVSTDT